MTQECEQVPHHLLITFGGSSSRRSAFIETFVTVVGQERAARCGASRLQATLFRPERKLIVRNACFLDASRLFLSAVSRCCCSVARASASQRGRRGWKEGKKRECNEARIVGLFGHSSHFVRAPSLVPQRGRFSSPPSSFSCFPSTPPLLRYVPFHLSHDRSPLLAYSSFAFTRSCNLRERKLRSWSSEKPAASFPFSSSFFLARESQRALRVYAKRVSEICHLTARLPQHLVDSGSVMAWD